MQCNLRRPSLLQAAMFVWLSLVQALRELVVACDNVHQSEVFATSDDVHFLDFVGPFIFVVAHDLNVIVCLHYI